MKKKYFLGILLVILILVGLFLVYPLFNNNEITINNQTMKLSKGYSVSNNDTDSVTITNKTNTIKIYPVKVTTNLNYATDDYIDRYKNRYNVTKSEVDNQNKQKIMKTLAVAEENNKTFKITTYWFVNNNQTYHLQTEDADSNTDNIIKEMINSINQTEK